MKITMNLPVEPAVFFQTVTALGIGRHSHAYRPGTFTGKFARV